MNTPAPLARETDSKGRLTLGDAFANQTVIIEKGGGDAIGNRLASVGQ